MGKISFSQKETGAKSVVMSMAQWVSFVMYISDAKFEEENFSNIDLVISILISVLQKQAYMYVAFQMHVFHR